MVRTMALCHSVPAAPECLYFKSFFVFEIMLYLYVPVVHVYVHVYVLEYHMVQTIPRTYVRTGGRVNKAARDWLDALTAPEPGEQVPSQDDHAGAGARAGPHACEDCGGDPRCRHRCRVGTSTVVYRDAFYLC